MGVVNPAFPVQNFVPVPYAGSLTAVNVWLLSQPNSIAGVANGGQQILQAGHQSQVINTIFPWVDETGSGIQQYPSNAVAMYLANQNTAGPLLDKILMVYINNVNNINDVTVYWPDSGQLVTCPAGAAGYFPLMTNMPNCYVYNGYGGGSNELILQQQTQILFCNFAVPGFISQTIEKIPLFIPQRILFTEAGVGSIVQLLPPGSQYFIYSISILGTNINAAAAGTCSAVISMVATGSTGFAPLVAFEQVATAAQVIPLNNQGYSADYSYPLEWPMIYNPSLGLFPDVSIMCVSLTNAAAVGIDINIAYTQL